MQLNIQVCEEVVRNNAVVDLEYNVGGGSFGALHIDNQVIDPATRTGTFLVSLPNYFGATPINIRAVCRNSSGISSPSNIVSLNNCQALARKDSDFDGIPNSQEDLNCDNYFSPGDLSNPDNVDTDGDGVRDLVEHLEGTNPTNPGSSPRPLIYADGPFDPDNDGNSNAVAWRPSTGMWYLRDIYVPGNHLAVQWGWPGDTPFVFRPRGHASGIGVVRNVSDHLHWYFYAPGFETTAYGRINSLDFGVFGDNILPGAWEAPWVTSPGVARLYQGQWYFYFYLRNGTIKQVVWGGDGDVPKVQDYDGDGLFDVAVYRPSEHKTYVVRSSDQAVRIYDFGTGTADHTVRGDITGDGVDDVTFWEPITGGFTSAVSNYGFDMWRANQHIAPYYFEMQLGLYVVHVPMSWNRHNGKVLCTVVDHATGMRYVRPNNDPQGPIWPLQWGLRGDSLG